MTSSTLAVPTASTSSNACRLKSLFKRALQLIIKSCCSALTLMKTISICVTHFLLILAVINDYFTYFYTMAWDWVVSRQQCVHLMFAFCFCWAKAIIRLDSWIRNCDLSVNIITKGWQIFHRVILRWVVDSNKRKYTKVHYPCNKELMAQQGVIFTGAPIFLNGPRDKESLTCPDSIGMSLFVPLELFGKRHHTATALTPGSSVTRRWRR